MVVGNVVWEQDVVSSVFVHGRDIAVHVASEDEKTLQRSTECRYGGVRMNSTTGRDGHVCPVDSLAIHVLLLREERN